MANVSVTKTIKAPAAKVWAMVSNWGGTHDWIPGVGPVSVKGEGVGATRSADLDPATGFPGTITETLDAFDEKGMHFRYSIVGDSPIPIKDYVAEMRVTEIDGNTCSVLWQSDWAPSGALSENELQEAFTGLYELSLENVRAACE
ncbi:MAG: SRPBCC family protein [Gammaproteobacteria bacterium]